MNGFSVEIKETLSKIIRVEKATSKEDAERIVKERYYNQKIILDAEDLKSVDFEAHEDKFITMPTTELEDVEIGLQIYNTLMKYDNEHEREV